MSDGRVGAWITAMQVLKAAQKLKLDRKGCVLEPLPEVYWALIVEAQILSDLTKASPEVGHAAGTWLDEQHRAEEADRERFEEAMAKLSTETA